MPTSTAELFPPVVDAKARRKIAYELRRLADEIERRGVSTELVLEADHLVDAFRHELREQER